MWQLVDEPDRGSSPLARGGPLEHFDVIIQLGLIPAGAGRTGPARWRCGRSWAHPRWRGEDYRVAQWPAAMVGSSPLARGGPCPHPEPVGEVRLIPAGAGRTPSSTPPSSQARAHPRWRGEDHDCKPGMAVARGSSPLARGGPRQAAGAASPGGLIPAGAGRTGRVRGRGCSAGAHPRWRGEDTIARMVMPRASGSSPLARGGPVGECDAEVAVGLIPAGAGRTHMINGPRTSIGAHPRWRGEDACSRASATSPRGSSPLARGGRHRQAGTPCAVRLIPAGAGRTPLNVLHDCREAAHPRWRGEDMLAWLQERRDDGSSPLARGGPPRRRSRTPAPGLIPAGAGRT